MDMDEGHPSLGKLNYLTVDWPLDDASLFSKVRPVIVEIGFGNADYLIHLAETRPAYNIIGFEISSQSMAKAEDKIEKRRLNNVRPIHSPAETALAHLLAPESVYEFHINYPDPWFKKKHSRRRLIQRETVDLLTSRLVTGGILLLATDIAEYADMSDEILSQTAGLTNRFTRPWVHELAGRFRTKYEIKGYREGRAGHYFIYQRNEKPTAHPAVIKEMDMPHLFLHSPLHAAAIVERFETTRSQFGDVHIAILQAYANPKRDIALFEVRVEEPSIEQHTMIRLSPRDAGGEYIVQMTAVGHARPTYGMHRAVGAVGDWVTSLHEDSRILGRKLRG